MKTFYELFGINENASNQEIENAYLTLKNKYKEKLKNPFESEKAEKILAKIEVAYRVLGNEETRKAYDKDLSTMRADELMSNLQKNTDNYNDEIKQKEELEKIEEEKRIKKEEEEKAKLKEKLEKEKLKLVKEAIEKQISEQKKQMKIEQENKKKHDETVAREYRNYLRKMGVDVKEPFTVKKFFRILIATVIVFLLLFLIFQIPIVKDTIFNSEEIKIIKDLF